MIEHASWGLAAKLFALSLLVTLALTPACRAAARRFKLLDRPNPRSSHARVVPRAGGVAVLVGLASCLAVVPGLWAHTAAGMALAVGVAVVALLGLVDDRLGLPPLLRLAIQAAAAVPLLAASGPLERLPLPAPLDLTVGPAGFLLGALWIVAAVNFYNFLDGIDGLASLQGVITGLGLMAASWDPLAVAVGAALAGGCLGFLFFNWAPATIFLGDAGSGMLGYAFAALPFLAPAEIRPEAVLFVAMSLWLFLADATWTLLRRVARGDRWHQAHREHLYQRLVIAGWSHGRVAALLGLASAALTLLALAAWRAAGPLLSWATLGAALCLLLSEWAAARYLAARHPPGAAGGA